MQRPNCKKDYMNCNDSELFPSVRYILLVNCFCARKKILKFEKI